MATTDVTFSARTNADWKTELRFEDDAGDPIDLTGYTPRIDVVDSIGRTLIELRTTGGILTLDGAGGVLSIAVGKSVMATLPPGAHRWDLQMEKAGGFDVLAGGLIVVEAGITDV